MAVVNVEKNDQDKFDCPLKTCDRRGANGFPTPGAVGLHVKAHHKTLWAKLYTKEHGETPPGANAEPHEKPMNGNGAKHGRQLVGARYSARPKIDRRIEQAAHANAIATMEAACEVMALPSVRNLGPLQAASLFSTLYNVHTRQSSTSKA